MSSPAPPWVSICLHSVTLADHAFFLACRSGSGWRPSSVSVLSTRSPKVAACPLAPQWLMCRKSTKSLRSCSCRMRSLCSRRLWCARTPGTGATGRALSRMLTLLASGAWVTVPASWPPGAAETMNCLVTSPGRPHHPQQRF